MYLVASVHIKGNLIHVARSAVAWDAEKNMNPPECETCGHAPILHVPDGPCLGCIGQAGMQDKLTESTQVCTKRFTFQLSQREREQAIKADKESYPQWTVCVMCGAWWCQHKGYLCVTGDSTFLPYLETGGLLG
jgi:hypothetical protein